VPSLARDPGGNYEHGGLDFIAVAERSRKLEVDVLFSTQQSDRTKKSDPEEVLKSYGATEAGGIYRTEFLSSALDEYEFRDTDK
jgi:hypothetical protein